MVELCSTVIALKDLRIVYFRRFLLYMHSLFLVRVNPLVYNILVGIAVRGLDIV